MNTCSRMVSASLPECKGLHVSSPSVPTTQSANAARTHHGRVACLRRAPLRLGKYLGPAGGRRKHGTPCMAHRETVSVAGCFLRKTALPQGRRVQVGLKLAGPPKSSVVRADHARGARRWVAV